MPIRPPFALRPWLALLLLSPSLVLAEQPATLPDTQVIGRVIEESLPTTTSTDAKTLDQRFIRSFEDLGRRGEPGVNFNRTNKSINIRGLERDRVLTTIDGIRVPWLNDAVRNVSGGLDSIDFNSLSTVDIVRGANSSQVGSGSLGGAVQLRTLDPQDLLRDSQMFGTLLKTDYDSADSSWGLNAALAGRFHQTSWLLQAGQRQGHELETQGDVSGYGRSRTEALPADQYQQNLLGKLQQQFDGGHRVGLTGELFDREKEIDNRTNQGLVNTATPRFAIGQNTSTERNERQRLSLDYQFEAPSPDAWVDRAEAIVYWQNMHREDEQDAYRTTAPIGAYGRTNEIEKEQYGVTGNLSKTLANHTLTTGAEWSKTITEQYSAGYDSCPSPLLPPPATPMGLYMACLNLHTNQAEMPKTPGYNWALYVRDEIALSDTVHLTPGLRYDEYSFEPKETSGYIQSGNNGILKDNQDSKLSGSLLLTWQAHELAMLYAQWAQGFKAPDANELYTTFVNSGMGYARIGNPNLKPEESTGYEVGTRLGNDALGGSLSLFDNHYTDFIDTLVANPADFGFTGTFPNGFTAMGNRSKVRIYGAEGSAHWSFAPNWKIWSGVSWAVGKDQDTNQHLNSVAPLTGILGLGYEQERYGAELTLTAARARDKVETSADFQSPGYGVVDLTSYWQPAALDGVKLQAGLFNVLDKKYWSALNVPEGARTLQDDYYSEAGRSLRVSASWQY